LRLTQKSHFRDGVNKRRATIKKVTKVTFILTIAFAVWSCMGTTALASDFKDVPSSNSYLPHINNLKALGVADGIAEGLFGPEQTLTRAQFAKFISIAFGLHDNGNSLTFSDIQDYWAATYVRAACQAGIIAGTSKTTFSPGKPIKREEAAAMVWRYAEKLGLSPGKVLNFTEKPHSWAVKEISSVIAHGWYGKDVKQNSGVWSYRPQTAMTRQESAALIDLAMKDVPGSLSGSAPSVGLKDPLNNSDFKVDQFGQIIAAKFPGKVTSEKELEADTAADTSYYGSLIPPADRDTYGGLAGSSAKYGIRGTGFFAIQQLGSREVMKTPTGNLFFSLGMNGITANETYTMVKGREHEFEWLPPYGGQYQSAFITPDHGSFSFYMANKYRKTREVPTDSSIYAEAVLRLKKWGFNSAGAYSPDKYGKANNFPYVKMLPLSSMSWAKIDGISIFDIFAPDAEAKIDQAFKQALTPNKKDPLLIGYFIDNEYEFHKFYSQVPKLKASSAAIKGQLVQQLKNKYHDIGAFNSSWKTSFKSFEDLKEAELPLSTSPAWRDMDEFFKFYLDTFFGTVSRIYRKYDPSHLLLGDRWITTSLHNDKIRSVLAEVEGKYVDVISINYYTYKIENDLLKDVYTKSGGKPILISELGYGTAEQGLEPLLPNAAVNQFQRGMRYRNYVEGVASLDYVVGADLFNYVDQAGLGRYWQGIWGEHYNSGVVNVADRPYKEYLKGIMQTNYDIYKVLLRERPKFYYDFSNK
jgi:hypothetical protein